jgi:hypothetical protein
MANQRRTLLESIATIIADYRQGEVPTIDSSHVDRWVSQFDRFGFDGEAQVVILEQMERILKRYYISRSIAQDFITRLLTSEKLFGSNPAAMIRNVQFLRIQTKGSSQNDLLNLCEQILQSVHGFGLEDCGSSPVAYIYLDDCLYSGNRVRRDIVHWLSNAARGTTLHLIFFALHTTGREYSQKEIEQKAQVQGVVVKFWGLHEFHNSRWKPSRFDCFWARQTSGDELIDRYVQEVNENRQNLNKSLPPLFRPNNMPIQDSIFSSPAREIIEYAFLKVGAYIVSLPRSPNKNMRPLGYDYLESLGFGAILATYRNIANNCPLALWWGDPNGFYPLNAWYPLFPRTVNTASSLELEE